MKAILNIKEDFKLTSHFLQLSLKLRVKNTFAGFFWVIFNPILVYLTHCLIFTKVLNLNIKNIPLFLLGGVLPWSFFSICIDIASSSLLYARQLLLTFNIHPYIIILSSVLENFFLLLCSLLFLLIFFYIKMPFNFLYIPLLIFFLLQLFLFTFCCSFIVGILNIYYRDIKYISMFALNILFFLTPIVYPEEKLGLEYKFLIYFNPLYKVIKPIRVCIYEPHNLFSSSLYLESFLSTATVCLIAYFTWKKAKYDLFERL